MSCATIIILIIHWFKSFLSNRLQCSKRIKLAEKDDTLETNKEELAMKLNDLFSNAVIYLKIPKFENFDPLHESTDHYALNKLLLSIESILALLQYLQNLLNNIFL